MANPSNDATIPMTHFHLGTDLTGRTLAGRYRCDQLLARGGMAQVWVGTDLVLTRPVAIKVLDAALAADHDFLLRFRREAITAARLNHPSIVSIYDTCSDGGIEAIIMELVRGTDLRTVLDRRSQLPVSMAIVIGTQVADALHEAHSSGVIHRDIKPANLIVSEEGFPDAPRITVSDFGIAKALGSADLTRAGSTFGTAKYLAPEQLEGCEVGPAADIYSLGAVLYEALCGKAPFEADSELATALSRLHRNPLRLRQLRADVPRALDQTIMRSLARQPEDRFPSAMEFRAALLQSSSLASDEEATLTDVVANGAMDAGEATTSFAKSERSWLLPASLLLVVAGLLILLTGLFLNGPAERIIDRVFHGELLANSTEHPNTSTTARPTETLRIAGGQSFDPLGTPDSAGRTGEHDGEIPNIYDDDTETAWSTESYTSNFPSLKNGVGFYLKRLPGGTIREVVVQSAAGGWTFNVYTSEIPPKTLQGWGEPVASNIKALAGETKTSFAAREDQYVLIWITSLAEPNQVTRGYVAALRNIELRG